MKTTSARPVKAEAPPPLPPLQNILPDALIVQLPLIATDWNCVPLAMSKFPDVAVALPKSLNPVKDLAAPRLSQLMNPPEPIVQCPDMAELAKLEPLAISNRPAVAVELVTSVNDVN